MSALKMFLAVALWVVLGVSHVIAAPTLWVDDANGNIGTVDVATGAATVIGNSGVMLTDIAFDPTGNLFGVSFTNLYSINKTTGVATDIGALGISSANALVFGSDGTLYAAAAGITDLYTVNPSTGAATSLGNMGFSSAGDLAFKGGNLFLADTNDKLIKIDLTNLANSAEVGPFGFSNVFGLATPDNNVMYGIAGTQVFSVNTATGAGTLVTDYGGGSLVGANGSAFFTESGAEVPIPGTQLLLGSGLISLVGFKRKFKK
jgi:hypothetical protein